MVIIRGFTVLIKRVKLLTLYDSAEDASFHCVREWQRGSREDPHRTGCGRQWDAYGSHAHNTYVTCGRCHIWLVPLTKMISKLKEPRAYVHSCPIISLPLTPRYQQSYWGFNLLSVVLAAHATLRPCHCLLSCRRSLPF